MKDSVTVTVPFSFKGQVLSPSLSLNLAQHSVASLSNIIHLVATENKIDSYSYEYEVLESSAVVFSNATAGASAFLSGTEFDIKAYYQWLDSKQVGLHLQAIVAQALGDGAWNKDLEAVLYQAYEYGRTTEQGT